MGRGLRVRVGLSGHPRLNGAGYLANTRNFGMGKVRALGACYPRSPKTLATVAGITRERGGLFVEGAFRP